MGSPDMIAEVFWDLSSFRLRAKGLKDERYGDFVDLSARHSKIIGNIYENPELLK